MTFVGSRVAIPDARAPLRRRALQATLLALLLSPAPAAWAQADARPPILTLDEAIRLALASSRGVQIARLEVEKATEDTNALISRRKPNFDLKVLSGSLLGTVQLTFEPGSIGTFPTTGPIPAKETQIGSHARIATLLAATVSQPLTQLSTIDWGVKALTVGQDVAKEQLRAQEQTVRDRVQTVYYGLLQAQSGLKANTEARTLYEEIDRIVSDYVARQIALPAEGLAVKTTLARQALTDLTIRNTIATLKEQLNVLTGRSLTTDFEVVAAPDQIAFEADVTALETQALRDRPEVRQARLRAQQAEFDTKRTIAAGRPEISLTFQYLGLYNVPVFPPNIALVGVFGSWQPWDWGRKKLEVEGKRHTFEQARLVAQETEDGVRLDVRQRYRKIQETRAQLAVAELGQQTARERLRVATDRYRLEATLQRQLLEAQAALSDADTQYQQAVSAYWTARADFDKSLGGG